MEQPIQDQTKNDKLIQIVNEFFESTPVPVIEILNKYFFQTEDTAEKLELLRMSKLVLNLYEIVVEAGKENSAEEIN